jgi:hypothetical protein
MKENKSSFAIVNGLNLLPETAKKNLYKYLPALARGAKFKGIIKNGEIISVVVFNQKTNSSAGIEFLWTKSSYPEFTRRYGNTPGDYLIEELIRKGARNLEYDKIKNSGYKMLLRKKGKGLWSWIPGAMVIKINDSAVKEAERRTRIKELNARKEEIIFDPKLPRNRVKKGFVKTIKSFFGFPKRKQRKPVVMHK